MLKLTKIMTSLRKILFLNLFIIIAGVYLTSCNKSNEISIEIEEVDTVQSRDDKYLTNTSTIDDFIVKNIESKKSPFEWKNASAKIIYSAVMHSDSILSVGYVPSPNMTITDYYKNSQIKNDYKNNSLPSSCVTARDEIINQILKLERVYQKRPQLKTDDILPFGYEQKIPHIYIKITNPEVVSQLKSNKYITYVEPRWYDVSKISKRLARNYYDNPNSNFGCHPDPASILHSEDYIDYLGSKASWNYTDNGIINAWSISTGQGIGVCVIDTGASNYQENLNTDFTAGLSSNRSVMKKSTLYYKPPYVNLFGPTKPILASPHDKCGHGTAMAGVVAGPLAIDGNSIGVAYKADLLTIKATHDVLISHGDEINAVASALSTAADDNNIKIISMSLGTGLITPSAITSMIGYASIMKGKLVFAAAGTSIQDEVVIFPANLPSEYTLAITGVKKERTVNNELISCSTCHSGYEVDFSIVMEQSHNGEDYGPLTLPAFSTNPSPTDVNKAKYTGGTSSATATAAGIAALVWAAHPLETKDQIINRLVASTSLNTPVLDFNAKHGWGVLDAHRAITVW